MKVVSLTSLSSRESHVSRLRTKTIVEDRAKSGEDWPQIFICPEGANTEGKVLKKFKVGAFLAGAPIQPVCVHHTCTLTNWSWQQGYGYIFSMLPVLATLSTSLTVEFMPVYLPSQAERESPLLFAENVRSYIGLKQGMN